MKLIVEDAVATNGTIPVRWCLTRKEIFKLGQKGILRPHVLIVVVSPEGKEQRWLAPLEQLIQYVVFRKLGNNRIFGVIVWNWGDDVAELKTRYLGITKRSWDTSLIDEKRRFVKRELCDWVDQLDIVVPEGVFAKEPLKWFSWWVNWLHKSPSHDQCEFRKRAFISLPKIPIGLMYCFFVLLCFTLFLAIRYIGSVVLLLLGRRHIMWKNLHDQDSSWTRQYTDNDWVFFSGWRWPITPFFVIIYTALVLLLNQFGSVVNSFGELFRIIALYIFCAYGVTALVIGTQALILAIPNIAEQHKKKTKKYRKKVSPTYISDPAIWCNQISPLPVGLDSLPPRHRTIYLRFYDLKSRICKPFAES